MTARLVVWLLCVLTGLAPLALGSNRPMPWGYNALGAGLIGLLACAMIWREWQSRSQQQFGVVIFPLLLWLAALGWAVFQIMPLPGSPLAHPVWGIARTALGNGWPETISVNRDGTLASLMRLLTYATVFLAAFAVSRDSERAAVLLRVTVIAAALYAVYGLLRYASGIDKLLWFDQVAANSVTSTFVNRNSAATYFGLAACVSLVLLMRRARHVMLAASEDTLVRHGIERFVGSIAGPLGFELVLFILLLTTTSLTLSRAGVAATLVALLAGLLLQALRQRRQTGGGGVIAFVIFFGAAAIFAVLQMSGTRVVQRLLGTSVETEERLGVVRDTLAAISDHLWLGSGLGTFQDVFPLYRSATSASPVIWDKAHNDYLEILLGLGLPAASALLLGLGLLVARCFRGSLERRRNSHIPLAGAMAGVLAGCHALFDFSLQIQAVALQLALILGAAVAQSVSDRTR